MIKFFKAVLYQYWWETLLSHINIHEPKGVNPHMSVFQGREFQLCISPKSGVVSKTFPMSAQGFKRAVDWLKLQEKVDNV